MTEKTIDCPECKGKGYYYWTDCADEDSLARKHPCKACGGTGWMTEAAMQAAWSRAFDGREEFGAKLDALRKEVAKHKARGAECLHCGLRYTLEMGPIEECRAEMRKHAAVCEKNPVVRERDRLRESNAGLAEALQNTLQNYRVMWSGEPRKYEFEILGNVCQARAAIAKAKE